jgi:chromosome condensin MukBEF complex kleisin-like MukF subunit
LDGGRGRRNQGLEQEGGEMIAMLKNLLAVLASVFKIIVPWLDRQRKMKDEAQKQVKDSVSSGDVSGITAGFDRINRMSKGNHTSPDRAK